MSLQHFYHDFFHPLPWSPERDLVLFKDHDEGNKSLAPILRVDLIESENDFHVHADLPGVQENDLDISIEGNSMIIKGHRERNYDVENSTSHRVERTYGSVTRVIRLPPTADKNNSSATFENGVLTVTFPKLEPTPPATKIPITVNKK